ncbi:MAG: TylF/MycF/NovP-related O-methyltransferase [Bacteroidota bacterium]|nr:TylF/MycF/NovP-related O-methyltransferase [Bacteroidota bacterium]
MKLSQLINYLLGLLGLKIIRKSRLELVNLSDIEQDNFFLEINKKVKDYTLVPVERCYSLYQTVNYIIKNNIEGDLVECGVWKGGSSMLMAYTLLEAGISNRKIYLYDTFEGMTKPGEMDGQEEKDQWDREKVTDTLNNMCYSPIEEVKANMNKTGYPVENIGLEKGKVEETVPGTILSKISLLRLDTDWYESTKHELIHLYPLLEKHGVLIVDDYGAWQGARKATDEYFTSIPNTFLGRIDYTGRIVIK